ncbi:oxygenase MpaB family protein [Nocardia testacea]|uniref:Oxygenase MpaB family protein n=1 Tax=Nocardia testacea TaxID=248551 RepID=A0ABW7VPU2_9NOCA
MPRDNTTDSGCPAADSPDSVRPPSAPQTPDTAESVKRPRRWVDAEIARLDPETDYARIVHLIANYKLNDFVMNLTYATGFMANTVPPGGSIAIAGTGKAMAKPQTRYLDTVKFFWEWFFKGPSHPDVQDSLQRLNRLHAHLYEKFPESFRDNDEWLFTMANLACGADRMRDLVGAPRQPEYVQRAWHHFWRDIAAQMTGPNGAVHSFPETYEGLIALAEDYEAREYEYTPTGREVCEAMIRQFNERFLPKPLFPVGRTLVLSFATPAVRKRHGMANPNPVGKWVFHRIFRLIFLGQDRFLPDNAVPMEQVLRSPKYQAWRKQVRQRERGVGTASPSAAADTSATA